MRYDQQPQQDFGMDGYETDPEQSQIKQPRQPAQAQPPAGGGMAAPRPQAQPQTFAQMQRAGMARPPMGGNPMLQAMARRFSVGPMGMASTGRQYQAQRNARVAPTVQPMAPNTGAPVAPSMAGESAIPAGPGSIITTTAPASAGPAASTPTAPANGFDPMEWFRQQVMGGSQNVLDRSMNYLGGQIDDEYTQRERSLRNEMAQRGLADSTVYGGRMQDLNVGRRSAKADLGERLALEDLQRRTGLVDRMVGMDADSRDYLLRLLGFGYGG